MVTCAHNFSSDAHSRPETEAMRRIPMKQPVLAILAGLAVLGGGNAMAEMVVQPVPYEVDGDAFEGMLVYDDSLTGPHPGLLMVPNWMGPTEDAARKAARVAGDRYVVFVADMYGKDIRPQNQQQAAQAAGAVRSNRTLMRRRAAAALEVLRRQALASDRLTVDTRHLGAVGFCFGGTAVLELARSGASAGGFVSFHGNLDTPKPRDARAIKSPVLVLHGADDPYVPAEQVRAFEEEMRSAEVDWQLVSFGGAVHSFTDPTADAPGQAEYHPVVAARAFTMMNQFFDEQFTR